MLIYSHLESTASRIISPRKLVKPRDFLCQCLYHAWFFFWILELCRQLYVFCFSPFLTLVVIENYYTSGYVFLLSRHVHKYYVYWLVIYVMNYLRWIDSSSLRCYSPEIQYIFMGLLILLTYWMKHGTGHSTLSGLVLC